MASELATSVAWLTDGGIRSERRVSPRNSSIARAGDNGTRVRVMVSGWAFQFRTLHDGRRQILRILLPGDIFGLETLFRQTTDNSIQTSTSVVYLALSPEDVIRQHEQSAAFRKQVMLAFCEEQFALQRLVVRLGKCDAEERTAAFLTDLFFRLVQCGLANGQSYALELTQAEVADALGLHPIHLNRVLVRLRSRKLLSLDKKNVKLLDMRALSDLIPPMGERALDADYPSGSGLDDAAPEPASPRYTASSHSALAGS